MGFLYKQQCIADSKDISTTLEWITPEIVKLIPNSLRDSLRRQINSYLARRNPPKFNKKESEQLIQLPIFKIFEINPNLSFRYLAYIYISELDITMSLYLPL
jgi:hypothetical protein